MRKIAAPRKSLALVLFAILLLPCSALAWGNKGHHMINRMAWQQLPPEMPAFLRLKANGDEIEYLGPEPDRWRSPLEPELSSAQGPEHYIDLELADRLGALPSRRWQYVRALYAYGAQHPDQAAEMVPEKVGLQPWEATEIEQRLQSAFRTWREESAAHRDTQPTERAIVFYMGWLGHYVADASQPLHTTVHFDVWSGPNPHGYATDHGVHALFETSFVDANIHAEQVVPFLQKPQALRNVFEDYVAYIRQSNGQVEQLYALEKGGGFNGKGTPESTQFTQERIAAGVTMLDSMWLTAWRSSALPVKY